MKCKEQRVCTHPDSVVGRAAGEAGTSCQAIFEGSFGEGVYGRAQFVLYIEKHGAEIPSQVKEACLRILNGSRNVPNSIQADKCMACGKFRLEWQTIVESYRWIYPELLLSGQKRTTYKEIQATGRPSFVKGILGSKGSKGPDLEKAPKSPVREKPVITERNLAPTAPLDKSDADIEAMLVSLLLSGAFDKETPPRKT